MNRKIVAIISTVIFVILVSVVTAVYYQNGSKNQANTYTVIGTLSYAPEDAVHPGIIATSIVPNVSPAPSLKITVITQGNDTFTMGMENVTVTNFIFLNYQNKFNDPPAGFGQEAQGDIVKVSGEMSYETSYRDYVMNVTSIIHYSS